MEMTQARRGPSDRTLNRLIVGIIVVLLVGIPLIGVIYFLDRNVDPGPSLQERAIATAEEAVRKEPNKVSVRLALAGAYLNGGRSTDAVAQFAEVLTAEPTHRLALVGRGKAYIEIGDLASAKKDFQTLIDLAKSGEQANVDPQMQQAYYLLGKIALTEDRPADAVTLLSSALQIDRADADAMNLLGTALIATGKPKDAIDVLRRAVAFVPSGWCEPYAQLSTAYTATGDADGTTYANGMVAFCEGRPEEAKTALQPLASSTYAVDAMLGLAMIAAEAGDFSAATSYYTKVLETDPENFNAITGLKGIATSDHGTASSPVPTSASPAPSASAEGN
jgi:tetratricopeptide (TPR) repeat protein